MLRRVAPPLVALLLLASCESSTAPITEVQRLALVEIAGRPVVYPMPLTGGHERVADTLVLNADGTGAQLSWLRDSPDAEPEGYSWPLYWRFEFGRLEINGVCGGPATNCVATPHILGRFTGNSLVVDGGELYPDGARYVRIDAR